MIQLHLASPTWEAGADIANQPVDRAGQMRAWTAMETVRFMEGHDLTGPAELVRKSGVNGADLLQLSQQVLCTGVLLTPSRCTQSRCSQGCFLALLDLAD